MIIQHKFWIIITCLQLLIDQKTTFQPKTNEIKRFLSEKQSDSSSEIQKRKQIKQIEIQEKTKINLKKQMTYQYSFELHKIDELYFDIIEKQEVKGTIQIAWKQYKKKKKKYVYVSPQILESQKVYMEIRQNLNIILQKQFYTGTSFKFDAQQQKIYSLKIFSKPKQIFEKMAQIHIQQRITQINKFLNMTDLQKIQLSLSQMLHQTKMLINSAQNRYLFQKNTIKMTLHQIYQYSIYQQIECILIFVICLILIFYTYRLLRTKPIT